MLLESELVDCAETPIDQRMTSASRLRSTAAKLRDLDILMTLNIAIVARAGIESNEGKRAHNRR